MLPRLVLALLLISSSFLAFSEEPKPAVPATPDKPVPEKPAPDKPVQPAEGSKDTPAPLAPVTVTEPIVTTPARLPEPVSSTGVSVTIIDGKEDRVVEQHIQLADSIRNSPGIIVNQSGHQGDFTSMFTRGGNSNQTLFLYDGFKVNRQGGNFNLGPVDAIGFDRIEIVRGPSSSLYGTDAVTGAINIISAKGEGPPDLTTSAAAGTYGVDRETTQLQGSEGKFSYDIGASRVHRDRATFDNSALDLYNFSGRFDYQINDCNSLKLVIRGLDERKGFFEDSGSGYGPGADVVDPNDKALEHDLLLGIEYKSRVLPIWDMTLRFGNYSIDNHIESTDPNPPSKFGGFPQSTGRTYTKERTPQAGWQNDITAFSDECGDVKDIVTVGTDFESDHFDQEDSQFGNNVKKMRNTWSIYAQNHLELFQRAYITGGIRREQDEQFGEFTTARGDASFLFPETDSRLHGSVGSAFRTPSFYEFYSSFGNPNLTPEKNVAYDVGVEQHFWDKRITLGGTWFHNHFTNLIDFDSSFKFQNLREAKTRGLEFNAEIKPIEQFTLRATSTLMHTEDDKGQALLRRPGATHTAQAIAHPICGLDLSLDLIHESSRLDLGPLPANAFAHVHNKAFTRLDAAASYRFLCHWRVFGRIGNVTNVRYEEVKTFPSAGSNFLGGIEFNWRF